jgi:hypothetical protein
MADYIFIRKSRNAVSSFLHVMLNLLLAVASIGATIITGNCIIGLVLVVISKWRIFAVNHRYWWLNIRSSLVDFIVGISFVLLTYAAGTTLLPVHIALMIAYAVWLIIIKPRSSFNANVLQSVIAVLLGATAASIFAAITDSAILVVAGFLLGFAASNHVLVQNGDHDASFISLVCGLVFAEISWLSNSWLIIYTIGNTGICLSQLSLVLSVLTYTYLQIHAELDKHGNKLKFSHIALPVIFSVVVILVLIIGFSQPRFNIH